MHIIPTYYYIIYISSASFHAHFISPLSFIMAQEELVSQEWIVEVKSFLKASDKDVPASTAGMRLPKSIRNANAEAYTPQMVSLGPYHHRTLKDEPVGPYHQRVTHLSQMEFYKLQSTREALAAKNPPLNIEQFFTKITQPDVISKFEQFYDWKIGDDDIPKFGWMIIVDAFFLFQFLKNGFNFFQPEVSLSGPKSKSDGMPAVSSANIFKSGFNFFQRGRSLSGTNSKSNGIHMPAVSSIRCDIVKLENQVPLFLLKDIDNALQTGIFKSCLQSRIASLSSFQVSHDNHIEEVKKESHDNHIEEEKEEKHLLGCIHEYVSSFLQMNSKQEDDSGRPTYYETIITVIDDIVAAIFGIFCPHPAGSGRDDFLDKYNATALVKAGIKFKSFKGSGKIRFDKYSDTCYIPKIIISDTYTEVLLRNLLALELNDSARPKVVTQYVELMDCLIDTPEDVKLLRKCHVIDRHSMMITDDYVAKMWDGMSRPLIFSGFLEPPVGLKAGIREVLVKNYYKSKIKTSWTEFHGEHLSRPWKALALFVAIFVLFLTTLQTYCSIKGCEPQA